MKNININFGQPYPLGASVRGAGINFSMVNGSDRECGIIFYRKGVEQRERVLFDQKHRIGNICCALIEGINACDCEYNFSMPKRSSEMKNGGRASLYALC